jgi:hypothetical protein
VVRTPLSASGIGLTRPRVSAAQVAAAGALALLAAVVGVVGAVQPLVLAVPIAAALLLALAFLCPVTHLMLLLTATAVIGDQLQRRATGHLLLSDALLLTGLFRASVVMLGQRIEARRLVPAALMLAFMGAVLLQLVHGIRAGSNPSYAAAEARALLGFGAMLVAIPIIADPLGRVRLVRGLTVVGLALGVWGLLQWGLGIKGGDALGNGIRTNSDSVLAGKGQLHGGLYGYPVAVVMAAAALLSRPRLPLARSVLFAVLFTNLACLLLTSERTFWLTAIVGVGFVIAKVDRGRRFRGVVATATAGFLLLAVMGIAAPQTATALRERVLSIGQSASSDSVRWRVVETHHLLDLKVKPKPIFGWGLGNFLHWGKPWLQVPPRSTWFAHNGYLWLVWKTGLVVTALLVALLAWAMLTRAPPEGGAFMRDFRTASQAGLLVLVLSSVTFPSFNSVAITAVMGALLAVCFAPARPPPS